MKMNYGPGFDLSENVTESPASVVSGLIVALGFCSVAAEFAALRDRSAFRGGKCVTSVRGFLFLWMQPPRHKGAGRREEK